MVCSAGFLNLTRRDASGKIAISVWRRLTSWRWRPFSRPEPGTEGYKGFTAIMHNLQVSETNEPATSGNLDEVLVSRAHVPSIQQAEQGTNWSAVLEQQVAARKRRARGLAFSLAAYTLTVVPISFYFRNKLGQDRMLDIITSPGGIAANALVLGLYLAATLNGGRSQRGATTAVNALKESVDIRSVGILVDALTFDDPGAKNSVRDALTEMLPLLKPEDSALLNSAQRAKLCAILGRRVENVLYKDVAAIFQPARQKEVLLRVAILEAFANVGAELELPQVVRLCEGEARTAGERAIQDAARSCLPELQERIANLRAPNVLLRASAASLDTDRLLRPAAHEASPQSELLRGSAVRSEK